MSATLDQRPSNLEPAWAPRCNARKAVAFLPARKLLSLIVAILSLLVSLSPARAQDDPPFFRGGCFQDGNCSGGGGMVKMSCIDDPVCEEGNPDNPPECEPEGCGLVNNCKPPEVTTRIDVVPTGGGTFTAQLVVDVISRWNEWASDESPNGTLKIEFWDTPAVPDVCDPPGGHLVAVCEYMPSDHVKSWVVETGLSCAGAPYDFGTYSARVRNCVQPCPCGFDPNCICTPNEQPQRTWEEIGNLAFVVTPEILGCNRPPKKGGCNAERCDRCIKHGVNVGGGGPAFGDDLGALGLGPGATLRYTAGGIGQVGQPGAAAHGVELGRGWNHDYGERMVPDPGVGHVWLLTKWGTYVEWTDVDPDGSYETVSPSDEYRTLTYTGSEWLLRELDATVHRYGSDGRWLSTTDRNGNAKTATYTAGRLTEVTLPDGRSETFAYTLYGKLLSITEVGVGGASSRTWTYTWVGGDLRRVNRPDGTAFELFYGDLRHPGFVTRVELVAPLAGQNRPRRVLRGYEYDATGNVVRTWAGATTFGDALAVEKWQLAYDDPSLPAETTVTDPLGVASVYTLDRDTSSEKVKILTLSGDCPACSLGPNSQLFYEDADHPLLPTRIVDGGGHETLLSYDDAGQTIARTEAFGEPEERTTTWEYHPTFPAFPTLIHQPSVAGSGFREALLSYDPLTGDLLQRGESGVEATYPGGAFSLTTTTAHNAAGQPSSINPPGYNADDVTSFTYDPDRGNLLPLTRTDPIVGTTTFTHDAFNRQARATDPNGVATDREYEAMSRARRVIERGANDTTETDDLITRFFYNPFGDLACQVLPRNNATAYVYDAAGRLTEIVRGTAFANPSHSSCVTPSQTRERLVYTLDGAGHRVNEKLERATAATFTAHAETSYVYSTRCHLDRMIRAPGTAAESVTEHAYDCGGNLERTWDGNHPSAGQTNPATRVYGYDPLNRLTSITEPWGGAGGGSLATTYGYDVQDHLTTVTDGESSTTTYVYSDRDLMTSESSPVSGTSIHAYNDHGELESTTDARGITALRSLDAADRVILVDYPDDDLDTTYTYDDVAVAFSKGRLTRITRDATVTDYAYDRFGRVLQGGALSHTYDANGNPLTVVYPGSVTATYTYDFADRPVTLSAQRPGLPNRTLVTGATYKPFGPLTSLTLANTLTETRTFDFRYQPTGIALAGASPRLDWDYATDQEGNVLSITDTLSPAGNRSFGYQDVQYFLAGGTGQWGTLSWTYDRIGNRLTETRAGVTDSYAYVQNVDGGNTARLGQVALGVGGTRTYEYTPAGHVEQVASGGNVVDFSNDDTGQLAMLNRAAAETSTDLAYDGRGFLRLATETIPNPDAGTVSSLTPARRPGQLQPRGTPGTPIFADGFESGDVCEWSTFVGIPDPGCPPDFLTSSVTATYSSEGVLHALERDAAPTARHVFYFGGRPVALRDLTGTTETWRWVTTDHLGTPIAATSTTGALQWSGGFEPFGRDYTIPSAQDSGVFLRLPGQWLDEAWEESSLGAEVYYNVHRFLEVQTGRYSRVDPVPGRAGRTADYYRYGLSNPLRYFDPLGLFTIDPSCDTCVHPYLARDNRPLTEIIQNELTTWCRLRMVEILDTHARKCIEQSCQDGRIRCSLGGGQCDDPGNPGYTDGAGLALAHWLRRNGIIPTRREAILCARNPLNFGGQAASTVIHEWAHGCGYDAHGPYRIPGIPHSEDRR